MIAEDTCPSLAWGGGEMRRQRPLPVLQEDDRDAQEVRRRSGSAARMHFQISARRREKPWRLIGSGAAAAASARLSAHLNVDNGDDSVHQELRADPVWKTSGRI